MNLHEKKIVNIILYFANKSKNKNIERMKLLKLIWLSDRLHLNKYGRLISKDKYKALPFGSIASKTMDLSKKDIPDTIEVKDFNIKALKKADLDFFSDSDIEIMDYVWNKFKNKDPFELSDYSHIFKEWKRFEHKLNNKDSSNSYDIDIQDFFEFPETEIFDDILTQKEIELSKQEFNNHKSIQNFLNK